MNIPLAGGPYYSCRAARHGRRLHEELLNEINKPSTRANTVLCTVLCACLLPFLSQDLTELRSWVLVSYVIHLGHKYVQDQFSNQLNVRFGSI